MKLNIRNIIKEEMEKQILNEYYDNKVRFNGINKAISYIEGQLKCIKKDIEKGQMLGNNELSIHDARYLRFENSVNELRKSFSLFTRRQNI